MSPTDAPTGTAPSSSVRRVIVASLIGTSLEWYDFFIYGTAAALVTAGCCGCGRLVRNVPRIVSKPRSYSPLHTKLSSSQRNTSHCWSFLGCSTVATPSFGIFPAVGSR